MARNYEKRFSGLNRFVEAKQREAKGEDESKRPSLHTLCTAEDVKRWIPSIKREVEYLLQQISCPHESRNYSDKMIEQFTQRLDELKKEHKHFVAKVQRLDPSYKDITPWQPRGYNRKRSRDSHVTSGQPPISGNPSKKLCSPLLEKEKSRDSHVTSKQDATSSGNLLGLDYSSSDDES